jgi:outer membrane protein OmpA-like peptidoglycan-associated protein
MSYNKSLALAVCFAITGCAQTPQNDADGGHWWQFGSSDKVAAKEAGAAAAPSTAPAAAPAPVKPAATAAATPDAKAVPAPTPDAKPAAQPATVAKADTGGSWWWPFGSKEQSAVKDQPVATKVVVPMPDPKITQAWLDDYEPRLRAAIKDSNLQLERRENVLVVIAPVEGSFNPKRPTMLLPVTLGPFTRVAKILEVDPKTAVLILGHTDTTGVAPDNQKLSLERAQSVAAIFSLSGLKRDRLMMRGLGGDAPRAANDSEQGRALNRRMEMLVTPQNTMVALLSKYNMPMPAPTLVAVQDVKPAAAPVAPAPATQKTAETKKAPAKKVAAATPAKKAPAKTPAKKTEPAKADASTKKVAATDAAKN